MTIAKGLVALAAALTMGALTVKAETDDPLAIAIGTPGSASFAFGTELWAMSQIALLPKHKIALDSREVAADEDRLALLQEREVEAALVYGRVPEAYADDVRAIMALWPEGERSDDADPVQFLVHKDVAADVVYLLTRAMFEQSDYFRNTHAHLGIGSPSVAMTGLETPLHDGAFRYFKEHGVLDEAVAAADPGGKPRSADVLTAGTFRDFDDASLKPGEIEQIAAACRHALEIGSLSLVLGDLDNTGCEVYQDKLTQETTGNGAQPAAVATFATTLPAAPAGGDAEQELFADPVGQGGPAILWQPPGDAGGQGTSATGRQPVM